MATEGKCVRRLPSPVIATGIAIATLCMACGPKQDTSAYAVPTEAPDAIPEGATAVDMGQAVTFGEGYRVIVHSADTMPMPDQPMVNGHPPTAVITDVEVCAGSSPMPQELTLAGLFSASFQAPMVIADKSIMSGYTAWPNNLPLRKPLYPEHGTALAAGDCLRANVGINESPNSTLAAIVYDSTDIDTVPDSARVRFAWRVPSD